MKASMWCSTATKYIAQSRGSLTLDGAVRVVALFPGVGSEYAGMAARYYDRYAVVRQTFNEAADVLGTDITDLCLNKTAADRLHRQLDAQLAVLVTSVAIYRAFATEVDVPLTYFAGHSLGEYSALCSAGALSFADALTLVHRRGQAISAVAEELDGSMTWVMGLETERVERICRFWNEEGYEVYPAIFDGPRHVAISGRRAELRHVAAECEARGARILPLRLTGPFHSPLMREAAEQMEEVVSGMVIGSTAAPVFSNVTSQPHPGGAASTELLVKQLVSPVRWYNIQKRLVGEGVGLALEIGPGRVLTFVLGSNGGRLRSWPVDDYPDLRGFGEALRLGPADAVAVLDGCVRVAASTPSKRPEACVSQQFQRLEATRLEIGGDDESRLRSIAKGLAVLDDLLTAKGLNEYERLTRLASATGGRVWAA